HQHLLVEKGVEGEVTQSRVRLLEAAGRVQEIARMLGGRVITPQTLAHAEEMLMLAGEPPPMVTS
ncbi:MAG: DNA repair protein RecN, partial [Gammaproteobacteria bacterium]|nr:DNA repair protein RecN [Gammaproteobacteria bacterium]